MREAFEFCPTAAAFRLMAEATPIKFVASGFSRKAVAVVNLLITSRSLPPDGGSHTAPY
jgi:hypothetical protein